MMISAIVSPDPLEEAKEGTAADLLTAIAESDCPDAEDVWLRTAPACLAGILDSAVARSDRMADITNSIDRRGGRSR